jgi:hypothetical protein
LEERKIIEMMINEAELLRDGSPGLRGFFILDEGVGDVVLLLLENEGLDDPEF